MNPSQPPAIRPAKPDDAPAIADFNCRLAWETEYKKLDPATVAAGVKALIAQPERGRYFLACLDDQIVGQLMVTYEWSDWRNGQMFWIQSVYVDAVHRRRGVFRQLYEHLGRVARDERAVAIRLYVERENATAQAVYRRLGLTDSGYFVLEQHLG